MTGATVSLRGITERGGTSGSDGVVTLQNIPAGTQRVRVMRDGFITLEKEVTIRSAARTSAEAVLSVAPPPPAPPPPPSPTPTPESRPTTSAGTPGVMKMLFVPEMAEQMLKDTQPIVTRQIGCSGLMDTTLIVARENITHRHADVDEMVYLVAGEATLTIGGKSQAIDPGWFGLVPREQPHTITRRGRNPMVFLVVTSGKPCEK